jgi:pimeloyl-ACP methyl ester carboxylesterase
MKRVSVARWLFGVIPSAAFIVGATLMTAIETAYAQGAPGALATAASPLGEEVACVGPDGKRQVFEEKRYVRRVVTLAYTEGPKNGPTVIFLPGMGIPRHSYDQVARLLCGQFHVVLLDQRGQGDSSWALGGKYRVIDYGDDLVHFIAERLAGEPAVISGHSLGGLTALWIAANRPDLVLGVNAEDNPFLMSERGVWQHHWIRPLFVQLARRLTEYRQSGGDDALLVKLFENDEVVVPNVGWPYARRVRALGKFLSNLDVAGVHAADQAEQVRLDAAYAKFLAGEPVTNGEFYPRAVIAPMALGVKGVDPRVVEFAVTAQLNEGFDHHSAFGRVTAPSLVWSSDQDLLGVLTPTQLREIMGWFPRQTRTKLVIAQNTGHLIHAERPELFAREFKEFFSKAVPEEGRIRGAAGVGSRCVEP